MTAENGPSDDTDEAVDKPDVKHEETADFWRAMHAEEKRKKQAVSAKLSDALREVERYRAGLMRIRDCYPLVLASDDATDVASWFISQADNVLWGKPVLPTEETP